MHTCDLHLILPCATQGAGHAEWHHHHQYSRQTGVTGHHAAWDSRGLGRRQGDARRARGAAWVSQEVPTQLPPQQDRSARGLGSQRGLRGLQPQGGGASVPGGQAEVGAGPGWGLESESQTPKCVKRLLPPRKGFTKALLRSLKFKQ